MSYSTGVELNRHNRHNRRGSTYTLEEALSKIYLIKSRYINIPLILVGKRVRLILVEEEEEAILK